MDNASHARISKIAKTLNARLDWKLQSDEPCDLLDGLDYVLGLLEGPTREDGWICERHPELEWPHDDCAGPGCPRSAQVPLLMQQRRDAWQSIRALETMVADGARRIQELEAVPLGPAPPPQGWQPTPWRYDTLAEKIYAADGSEVAEFGGTADNRQDAAARWIVKLANAAAPPAPREE